MRIVQLLPTFSAGDAIGNEVLALNEMLLHLGYETLIGAANVNIRNGRKMNRMVVNISSMGEFRDNDIIIYHFSIGNPLNQIFRVCRGKKILRYHNITPPEFFKGYDWIAFESCKTGYEQLAELRGVVDICLADSEYNAKDLRKAGYTCPIRVLPILLSMKTYEQKPVWRLMKKYRNNGTNLLFTGRVVPNKNYEQLIDVFYYYKKYMDPDARLILAGNCDRTGPYYKDLCKYVERLELNDVIFTGYLDIRQLISCYCLADLFLCMSRHEGFCVPLVEAMIYRIPILAYNQAAVGETMGQAGILLDDADPLVAAELAHTMIRNVELKKQLIQGEQERLKYFEESRIKRKFLQYIQELMR